MNSCENLRRIIEEKQKRLEKLEAKYQPSSDPEISDAMQRIIALLEAKRQWNETTTEGKEAQFIVSELENLQVQYERATAWKETLNGFKDFGSWKCEGDSEAETRKREQSKRLATGWRDGCSRDSHSSHTLVLSGNCGTGKTHLAISIAREVFFAGRKVSLWSVPSLFGQLRDYIEDHEKTQNIMRNTTMRHLLVLDDLGVQRGTLWELEILYRIIDSRCNQKRYTIITTNHPDIPTACKGTRCEMEVEAARIASRLREGSLTIRLDGLPDWRLR